MRNAPAKNHTPYEDLPLFQVSQHRRIWEGLPRPVQQKTVQLLSDLFLAHVGACRPESIQRGDPSHE